jgi:hypothetical protein
LAYNRSTSYATTDVLESCQRLLKKLDTARIARHEPLVPGAGKPDSVEQTLEKNNDMVSDIFKEIRKDIAANEIRLMILYHL